MRTATATLSPASASWKPKLLALKGVLAVFQQGDGGVGAFGRGVLGGQADLPVPRSPSLSTSV